MSSNLITHTENKLCRCIKQFAKLFVPLKGWVSNTLFSAIRRYAFSGEHPDYDGADVHFWMKARGLGELNIFEPSDREVEIIKGRKELAHQELLSIKEDLNRVGYYVKGAHKTERREMPDKNTERWFDPNC